MEHRKVIILSIKDPKVIVRIEKLFEKQKATGELDFQFWFRGWIKQKLKEAKEQ